MRNYFFDTSALVKRYQTKERGSEKVNKIFLEADCTVIILNLTMVEIIQTFCRLSKISEIKKTDLTVLIDSFYRDVKEHIQIYTVTTEHTFRAEEIIRSSLPLKTLNKRPGAIDILQVCAALDFNHRDLTFVSSDLDLNQIAKAHKLTILNPESETSS